MSVWVDRKYLGFVSSRLDLFKQKSQDLYNFRCPYCGDSKKNRLKARGYVYRKSNDYFFICHNCSKSTTFGKFLQDIDGSIYRQYALERYTSGDTKNHNYKKPSFENLRGNAYSRLHAGNTSISLEHQEVQNKTWHDTGLECIANLPDEHYARDYIKKRRIPQKFWNEIFFAPKFRDFLDKEFPNHGKEEVPNDDRIVLFYTNELGEITNVAGRSLSDTKVRYVVVKVSEEKKLFGLHRLSKEKKVYVLEGQFDSLFIENSLATGDSNLRGVAAAFPELDTVLVYDREPRNKELVDQISKAIKEGYNVCLFPEDLVGKDVNEMIQNGLTADEIKRIIDDNTFSGLTAELNFMNWKRC